MSSLFVMEHTRLSSKGQVVIPRSVRERHRWKSGQEFDVIDSNDGVLLRPSLRFPASRVEDIGKSLDYGGVTIPIDQLSIEGIPFPDPDPEDGDDCT